MENLKINTENKSVYLICGFIEYPTIWKFVLIFESHQFFYGWLDRSANVITSLILDKFPNLYLQYPPAL